MKLRKSESQRNKTIAQEKANKSKEIDEADIALFRNQERKNCSIGGFGHQILVGFERQFTYVRVWNASVLAFLNQIHGLGLEISFAYHQ
jgi:hydroxyacyl-ACP dehydratase HTD2-like protein with hotdog domain